jgi:hypothetical protein
MARRFASGFLFFCYSRIVAGLQPRLRPRNPMLPSRASLRSDSASPPSRSTGRGLVGLCSLLRLVAPLLAESASNYSRFSFYAPRTQIFPVIGHHYPRMEVTPFWIFSYIRRGLPAWWQLYIAGKPKRYSLCLIGTEQVLESWVPDKQGKLPGTPFGGSGPGRWAY